MASCGCSILHAWRASQTRQPGRQGSWVHDLQTGLVKGWVKVFVEGWHNKICNFDWWFHCVILQIFRMIQEDCYDCYVSGRLKPPIYCISLALHLDYHWSSGSLHIFSMPTPDIWGSGTLRWDYYDILGLEQAATSSDAWMNWVSERGVCHGVNLLCQRPAKTPMIELLTTSGVQKSVANDPTKKQCLLVDMFRVIGVGYWFAQQYDSPQLFLVLSIVLSCPSLIG